MARDIRTVNCTEGQKLESDDMMKRIGDISYRNMGTMARIGLFDEGDALIIGDGIRVEATTGLTVNVTGGIFLQRIGSDVIPCIQTADQTVTIAAASGAPRTDIIEAQIKVIADKTDYSLVATVATGTAVSITNEEIDRDIKVYLSARKQTGTTTPTAATAGTLTGTVAITSTLDLSEKYLLNLSDGEDGSWQEIDCRGATPAATTKTEIINAINAATGRTMASAGSGNVIVLTGTGTGQQSYFQIKPPITDADADCLEEVFGVSSGGVYKYTYTGTNEWIKLAEIDMGASTVTITAGEIRNIDQKDTWTGGDDILVRDHIYQDGTVTGLDADMLDEAHKSTDGTFATNSDDLIPTEKATKTYITNQLAARFPVGSIIMMGSATADTGFLKCDGSAVSRTTYASLFSRISTTYGVGDGSTTFNIPNFTAVVPKQPGNQTIGGNVKSGPTLGSVEEDQFQTHIHGFISNGGGAGDETIVLVSGARAADTTPTQAVLSPTTGRTGTTTRENSIGVYFQIKY